MIRVPRFIVISGGEAGAFYVRQLRRAVAAGRLETGRVVVIDRERACRAAAQAAADPLVQLETAEWSDWLAAHLGGAGADDHLVAAEAILSRLGLKHIALLAGGSARNKLLLAILRR